MDDLTKEQCTTALKNLSNHIGNPMNDEDVFIMVRAINELFDLKEYQKEIYENLNKISQEIDQLRYKLESLWSISGLRGEKALPYGGKYDYKKEIGNCLVLIDEDVSKNSKYIKRLKDECFIEFLKELNIKGDD